MASYEFVKAPDGLLPADKDTAEFVNKIDVGELVQFSHHRERNLKKHRKYWAVLSNCVKRGGVTKYMYVFRTKEQLHFVIMQLLGVGEWIQSPNGRVFKPDSIAFDNMDEDEFDDKVFRPMIDLLCDMFDTDPIELMEEY